MPGTPTLAASKRLLDTAAGAGPNGCCGRNSVEKLDLNYGAEWFRNEQTGFSISWFSFLSGVRVPHSVSSAYQSPLFIHWH
jgi:hypothetical protein